MATTSNTLVRTVAAIAAIALVVFVLIAGNLILGIGVLVLLLIMGGGALLYRKAGPPER